MLFISILKRSALTLDGKHPNAWDSVDENGTAQEFRQLE